MRLLRLNNKLNILKSYTSTNLNDNSSKYNHFRWDFSTSTNTKGYRNKSPSTSCSIIGLPNQGSLGHIRSDIRNTTDIDVQCDSSVILFHSFLYLMHNLHHNNYI